MAVELARGGEQGALRRDARRLGHRQDLVLEVRRERRIRLQRLREKIAQPRLLRRRGQEHPDRIGVELPRTRHEHAVQARRVDGDAATAPAIARATGAFAPCRSPAAIVPSRPKTASLSAWRSAGRAASACLSERRAAVRSARRHSAGRARA
jgi:hypothetical protein